MDTSRSIQPGHTGLVGLPVFLTMVFCFALVLAHPSHQASGKSDASASSSPGTTAKESSIDVKPVAHVKLAPSDDTTAPASSGAATTSAGEDSQDNASDKTSTPQPGNSSHQSLQSAGQYYSGERINVRRTQEPVNDILDKTLKDL